MAQQAMIRGLAIRANFALARAVFEASGDAEAEFDMTLSIEEALWLGFNERFKGAIRPVPAMFADEPQLHGAWLDGCRRAVSALLDLEDARHAEDEVQDIESEDELEEVSAC